MPAKPDERRSQRSPVALPHEVVINGHIFQLHDVGLGGCGVIVANERVLFIGQRLHEIAFKTDGQPRILKGIVSHITRTRQHLICGIRFELSGPDDLMFVTALQKRSAAVPSS